MATKKGLSASDTQGVYDKGNQAYSDSNAAQSFEMTQAAEPASPPASETVLWSPAGKSLMMKAPDGTITTVGPDASGPELAATADYTTTTPAAPLTGLKLFVRHRARRNFAVVGPTGLDMQLQTALFSNKVHWITAISNNATLSASGLIAANVTAPSVIGQVFTSFFTAMARTRYTTAATAGAANGMRATGQPFFLSSIANLGGFFATFRFGIATSTATSRLFAGFASTGAALGVGEPSALFNIIGVGNDSADVNLQMMFNDAAGVATKVDLGVDFPSKTASTWFYDLTLFSPSGSGQQVYWAMRRLNDGITVQGGPVNTNLPAIALGLSPHVQISNGTTAAAAVIDVQSIYVETDN